jgi:predicted dehydrogenase
MLYETATGEVNMTNEGEINIGFVGAGGNTRLRHIPGFKALEGVVLVSVANRTRESGQRIADEFDIPVVYDDWRELIEADDTDAICIGTWPYMHSAMVLAALENDKHVITESRMAMNATEAHIMLDASRESPHLVTQIVPSTTTYRVDATIQELIADGFLGQPLAIDMRITSPNFIDQGSPLHWRQDQELSGYNILNMGIWYECITRWVGPATKVMAMTKVATPLRKDSEGLPRAVTIPDHVDILCEMACGAQARMGFSSFTGLAPGGEVWLYGSEGTLRIETSGMKLFTGRRGDQALEEFTIAPEKQGNWRVEEEFINAIRGKEKVTRTSFEDGVRYMEFTEAVTRSAQEGKAISLPLY